MSLDGRRIYFMGCRGGVGHYFVGPRGSRPSATCLPAELRQLDGPFCPGVRWDRRGGGSPHLVMPDERPEGLAALHHVAGWTVLSLWDRSVDSRHGSHATFAIEGEHHWDAAEAFAREGFPEVWARFTFPLVRGACGELR